MASRKKRRIPWGVIVGGLGILGSIIWLRQLDSAERERERIRAEERAKSEEYIRKYFGTHYQ